MKMTDTQALGHKRLVSSVALVAGLLGACGATTEEAHETGELNLPLVTTAASGVEYRLSQAEFVVDSPFDAEPALVLDSDAAPDAPTLSVSLPPESYEISLRPGWVLERVENGVAEAVEATLLSSDKQWTSVYPRSTSWVNYQFGVGDKTIWLNGKLNIGIDVLEDPNGSGGSGGEGGSGGTTSELLDAQALQDGWIGGDPATADDNPAGVQGALYAFGDDVACYASEGNPCSAEGCCLDYTTVFDATYRAWGCGVGLMLNSDFQAKFPYAGPAAGFAITYSNTGLARLRFSYTQSANTDGEVQPFADVPESGRIEMRFNDVACPSWAMSCPAPSANPYDLWLQVVGGDSATRGRLCITSIQPLF
jgi:hypothetical protein